MNKFQLLSFPAEEDSGIGQSRNLRLLEKSFSPENWQQLSQNKTFMARLSLKNDTLDDYEDIAQIGGLLIQQPDELREKKDWCSILCRPPAGIEMTVE